MEVNTKHLLENKAPPGDLAAVRLPQMWQPGTVPRRSSQDLALIPGLCLLPLPGLCRIENVTVITFPPQDNMKYH